MILLKTASGHLQTFWKGNNLDAGYSVLANEDNTLGVVCLDVLISIGLKHFD